MNRTRKKVEVPEAEFNEAIKGLTCTPIDRGAMYTQDVAREAMTWRKPIAVKQAGKFYLVKEE